MRSCLLVIQGWYQSPRALFADEYQPHQGMPSALFRCRTQHQLTCSLQRIYSDLPNVEIEELRFNESDLNTKRMLDLMAVNSSHGMPLYMSVINRILRELRIE